MASVASMMAPTAARTSREFCLNRVMMDVIPPTAAGLSDLGHSATPHGHRRLGAGFIVSLAAAFGVAFMQAGCVHSTSTPVWNYYDQCAAENPSFLAMAECGRARRLAECTPSNSCSPEGTIFMDYVDSLALAVKNKKMTDAEAMRRYAEYKSGGASPCMHVGDSVKCY